MSYNNDINSVNSHSRPITGYRSSDDDENRRKTAAAPPKRDFKKVLGKEHDEDDARKAVDQEGEGVEETDEDAKKGKAASLFDLNAVRKPASAALAGQVATANSPVQKTILDQSASMQAPVKTEKEVKESPSNLFSKLSKSTSKKEGSTILSEETAIAAERDVSSKSSSDDASTDADAGGGSSSLYTAEQSDLSYVNPLAATTLSAAAIDARSDASKVSKVDMQKIIDQLVDKVYVVEKLGQSDTVVTLKEPPMFAGASLTVTSFDSARGEFNIAFNNLTQAAQHLLSLQVNKDSLLHGLEQKGYAVHIITATTQSVAVEAPQQPQDRQRQNEDRGQERRGGQPGQGQGKPKGG